METFKKFIFLGIFLNMAVSVFPTGASYITAKINPVSVNKNGDILCRTIFEKNPMGAHALMDIEYGYCILTADTILQFGACVFDYPEETEYESFIEQRNYQDSVYYSCIDFAILSEKYPFTRGYGFKECNAQEFRKDSVIAVKEFESQRNLNLSVLPQKALYGARGFFSDEEKDMHISILFDFGNIIIIENKIVGEIYSGSVFDYPNPIYTINKRTEDVGYENFLVTGILFIDK